MSPRSKALILALLGLTLSASAGRAADVRIEPIKDQSVNSPKEDLRKALFQTNAAKPGCLPVKVDPHGKTGVDPSLDAFLKDVLTAVKDRDKLRMQPLFHRRLNIDLPVIDETFAKLANVYGMPFDVTALRLWALNTVDGTPGPQACPGDDLSVSALYGYPLQFGAWLQIMGPKELGRVFVAIVPADGGWRLGSFHAQQWTHLSKDGATWANEAAGAASKGLKPGAHIKYDIAAKLLDGGNFLDLAAKAEVEKARDAVMNKTDWDKTVRDTLKGFDVIYTASLLVLDGAGILVRVRIPEEISVERIKTQCTQMAQLLAKESWSSEVGGIRCGFNLPKEDAQKEGALGGIYTELKKK